MHFNLATAMSKIKPPKGYKSEKYKFITYDVFKNHWQINGQSLVFQDDVGYQLNYPLLMEDILESPGMELSLLRFIIQNDLWALIRFVKQVPDEVDGHKLAGHRFWVERCRDVQTGPADYTMDLWAREHGKSTIITTGESLFIVLNNPETTHGILSYNRATAITFLKEIKFLLEGSQILHECFPDILFSSPEKESQQWALENGLLVKRKGSQREMTFEAYGLIDGMPTGRHFTHRWYDDISTYDLAKTPQSMEATKNAFDMSHNLGTFNGVHRVVGTYYHYEDALVYISKKREEANWMGEEKPLYTIRKFPSTVDGTMMGESIYLPEFRLKKLRVDKSTYATQMLLEPNPMEMRKLHAEDLKVVSRREVPKKLYKFIVVDPAGSEKRKKQRGDDWAIFCIGVNPFRGDFGLSDIYILDGVISELTLTDAQNEVVDMFARNGKIRGLAVEKVGLSSAEIHLTNALKAKSRIVSKERGNLMVMNPTGRKKQDRILTALTYPMENGKWHIVENRVPVKVIQRLKMEMDKFPFYRDDGLDALSWIYDVLKDYRFPLYYSGDPVESKGDAWDFEFDEDDKESVGWMGR